MITIKILGGLGNQMFQYAFGRSLANLHQTSFNFETEGLHAGEDIRKSFELSHFSISDIRFTDATDIFKYSRTTKFGSRALQNMDNIINKRVMIIEKGHFPFNKDFIKQSKQNTYIRGLWQSEKYFMDVEGIIRSDFTFKDALEGKNLKLANFLKMQENSVAIHVRRGEFANDPKYKELIGSCDMDYYKKAIAHQEKKHGEMQHVVFSDDIKWAKENLPVRGNAIFVDYNMEKNHHLDMLLMSLCKHNIIANSTFSWWGAWLNKNANKTVIAPKKWFGTIKHDTTDLIPTNWLRI